MDEKKQLGISEVLQSTPTANRCFSCSTFVSQLCLKWQGASAKNEQEKKKEEPSLLNCTAFKAFMLSDVV